VFYYIAIILAAVVTVVWWATMWAPTDRPSDDVDAGVDNDTWPPSPKT